MAGESRLQSCAHLVAHLLREIESALRDALEPLSEDPKSADIQKRAGGSTHKAEILAVAKGLGIPEKDDGVIGAWLNLAGRDNEYSLSRRAHRKALSPPRSLDDQFIEFWRTFQNILDVVLEYLETQYLDSLDAIDALLAESTPSESDIKRLRQNIPNNLVNRRYFFSRLTSEDWLELLEEEGFFDHPPVPLTHDDGSISFPQWPESDYLERMASSAPEIVLRIALRIPETENVRVYEDLSEIALAMPAEMAAGLVLKIKEGLNSPYQLLLPDKAGKMVSYLASEDEIEAALDLARHLLAIFPDPRVDAEDLSSEDMPLGLTPRARFDAWQYGQILKNEMPTLVEAAGTRTLSLLCDLLEKTVRLSKWPADRESPRDFSHIWRSAIEVDEERSTELRGFLVSGVRDAAVSLIGEEGKRVLNIVEARPYRIFQRIGLYLRRRWPQVDPEGTARIVQEKDLLNAIDLRYEMFHLLREAFGNLPQDAQDGYFAYVEEACEIQQWATYIRKETGEAPTTDQLFERLRRWQYEKLVPIETYLQGEWRQRFEEFCEEFGELESPDFPYRPGAQVWWGPTSPRSAEELGALSPKDLIGFLKSWRPSGELRAPTSEGLGRMLTRVVAKDPVPYARHAEQFEGLEPAYVRGILLGLEEAAPESKDFVWSPVIELCHWVVEQPREIPGRVSRYSDLDPGWVWTRKAIAGLLSEGLKGETGEMPYSLRSVVWEVLTPLTQDPDPTPAYEAEYGGSNMSPLELSINTVRGEAVHAVVRYALWVRRHIQEEVGPVGFGDMPEVREILDLHLDPTRDPSLAIRAVYGHWFPSLMFLDADWAEENIPNIFPADETLRDLRDAAWHTYVVFCRPYSDVFDLLRREYSSAIERIGAGSGAGRPLRSPDQHLAQHLMVLYWWGRIDLQNETGLLHKFYEQADDALRAHALTYVGGRLHDASEPLSSEMATQLRNLWSFRLDAALSDDSCSHGEEMAAFGWWFTSMKFDEKWMIDQLKQVLRMVDNVQMGKAVIERLAEFTVHFPLDCVECLGLMVSQAPVTEMVVWQEPARTLLIRALKSGDEKASQAARAVINQLGAKGHLGYRDLLTE